MRRGSTVLAVDGSTDAEVQKAQTVTQKLGTVALDQRAAQWKSKGWNAFDPNSFPMTEDELAFERDSVPVVQKELVVGKRKVDVGGLRVVKRNSETPVSEMINLRQEKATVQRKPVDRAATEADLQNFKEGTFEVQETAGKPSWRKRSASWKRSLLVEMSPIALRRSRTPCGAPMWTWSVSPAATRINAGWYETKNLTFAGPYREFELPGCLVCVSTAGPLGNARPCYAPYKRLGIPLSAPPATGVRTALRPREPLWLFSAPSH